MTSLKILTSSHGSMKASGNRFIGVGDLFKIGIGPSSSHTIGPMKAAASFRKRLGPLTPRTERIVATVFGSLAWTGKGHATDQALAMGLSGVIPELIDPDHVEDIVQGIKRRGVLHLEGGHEIAFDPDRDIVFNREETFERHPNAMIFEAYAAGNTRLVRELWFSVGGGFVIRDGVEEMDDPRISVPYPFQTADELLRLADEAGLSVAKLMLANECAVRPESDVILDIQRIAYVMLDCITRGLTKSGILPGGLQTERRARRIYEQTTRKEGDLDFNQILESVSAFAIAVNEENAAGARVVTAPTNGAAGVLPAVLRYYCDFCSGDSQSVHDFFLAAAAIGSIIKRNASISGAEVGCQGEVGTASAMAAAGLTASLGGSNAQVENAAEIALEHHLGMTCDPVAGLVQIPCIERNAFGAIKAITATLLSLKGSGIHRVSLDQVIETMRQTGLDMHQKYKETSRGGLALNVAEC